jgi:hypothetical protein
VLTFKSPWWAHWFGISAVAVCAAFPLSATVLETFESTTSWTVVVDPRSSVIVSTIDGVTDHALELEFGLRNGLGVGISKTGFASLDVDVLGANALRFFYKAASLPNTIEVKLSDSDFVDPGLNTKAVLKFTAKADNQWHEVIASFNSFAIWKDTGLDGDTNNATFDWSKVSHLSYGVSGSSGVSQSDTIRFEDFSFYHLDAPVPLVNSYEYFEANCWVTNSCKNERPSPLSSTAFDVTHPEWGSSMIVSTQAVSGTHSREIRYSFTTGGFFGVAEQLEVVSVLATDEVEFYAKGAVGGEPLHVQVKSSTQAFPFATVETLSPVLSSTTWQKYSIPFSSFKADPTGGAGLDLNSLSEVVLLFEHLGVAKSGRVYIDDIKIVRPGVGDLGSVAKTLEDYSGAKLNLGYGEYPRDTVASLSFTFDLDSSIGSSGNKVGRLDYSFKNSSDVPWAVVERPVGINLLAEPNIRFRFKGDGSAQNIEVWLTDTDSTIFKKTLFNASNTNDQWKTATIPVTQFSFFAPGEDSTLALTRINEIGILLVPGGTSAGIFAIDSLELVSPPQMEATNLGGLISSVATPDNPFSPNGDGLKDVFTVNYALTDSAQVLFRVFNLQGVPLRTVDYGSQPSGNNVITWDGHDDGGTLQSNGVYFFTVEAKSDFSGDQTFRQIVGVMR